MNIFSGLFIGDTIPVILMGIGIFGLFGSVLWLISHDITDRIICMPLSEGEICRRNGTFINLLGPRGRELYLESLKKII